MIKLRDINKLIFENRPGGGDCYQANGREFLNNSSKYDFIVHGEVAGQGALSDITFGHAWLLKGNTVYDFSNGREIKVPKQLYYALGNIDKINNMFKYTFKEFQEKLLEFEHWGPWDLKTTY